MNRQIFARTYWGGPTKFCDKVMMNGRWTVPKFLQGLYYDGPTKFCGKVVMDGRNFLGKLPMDRAQIFARTFARTAKIFVTTPPKLLYEWFGWTTQILWGP